MYHHYLEKEKSKKEIEAWLKECSCISEIDVNKIKEYFRSGCDPQLTNLTGKGWVSDNEINLLFNNLNKTVTNVMCLLCTPDKYVPEDLVKKSKDFINGKVLIALNVQHDPSGRTFIADGTRNGNHWALLALDTEAQWAYYGDSLGWAIPSNLKIMVEPLLKKVGLTLEPYGINECNFYPRQTCSDM